MTKAPSVRRRPRVGGGGGFPPLRQRRTAPAERTIKATRKPHPNFESRPEKAGDGLLDYSRPSLGGVRGG